MASADSTAHNGPEPEGFGSALVDEAARRDAALGDVDWAAVPEGAVRGTFDAPSGPLATLSMGTPGNPRVLMIPGATGSKEDFVLMLPELAAAGYFAVSYDIAGQYDSAAAGPEHLVPERTHYDYDLFTRDLVAMLDAEEGAAHVVGYSFAAIVAQLACIRRPEKFRSLTLLSCPPEPGQGFRGVKRIGRFSGRASPRIGAALMVWGIRANVIHVPPQRLRFVKHRFRFTRRSSVSDIFALMQRAPDLRAALAAAALPKLVAVGEHDLWPLALHRRFAQSIGARIVVYRGGHSPNETSPYQLSRDLIALYESA
ncbi:alpha/beta fold hydrolase [Arthrobacter sp. H16F315]|uniref:alpha/beta fold hydrolase n=1 Tax=Arthrobacter sp. H16F315 TaxID=2955314 RepID=UPI002096AA96|nr:alpha/beta hydrolase [Arthrobacter sp. H16F315]MDD1475857.1 alpha/beta hydrolase [Arthrobacter sp. H16F315]